MDPINSQDATKAGRCEDCGAALSAELGGACPACLWGDPESPACPDLVFGEEIARGGMGIVYRARQSNPAREVAAKMLLPHLLDQPGLRERFANEARVAASLDHPGILPIYAVGESGGVPYFTMKLAEGGSLADRVKERGALPVREAVELMADLAEAIHHAHGRGVLHRDLKPGNILFDAHGRCFVSDFGLAKMVDPAGTADLTRTIALLGTPQYLPPEIARGSLREASTAGDIYALGAVLHELLAGSPPFVADTVPGLLRRIADEEFVPPAGLPRDLRAILGKCLEKDPARRFASAGDLAGDLRAWLDGRPVKARRPAAAERVGRWARRNPVVATLAACLAIALGLGLAGELRAKARLAESLADSQLARASLLRRESSGAARAQAFDLIRQSAALTPRPTPERAARLRSEVAAAFALPSLEESDHWKIPGNWNLIRPAFTRDLTRYAAPSDEGGFAIFDAATRQVLQTVPPAGKPGEAPGIFAFDRTGTRVAASSVDMSAGRSVTEVHELSGESPRLLGRFENSGVTGAVPVLFADGRIIVQGDDGLRIGRDEGDLVALALPVEKGRVIGMSLALSPDETRLAAALEDPPGLVVWALDHPAPRRVWQIEREAVPQCLTWSGDDVKLAFADRGTAPVSLVVAGAGDGNIHATLPGHGKPVATLAFHPDGDSIASVGFDQWVVWQAIEAGGFRVRIPGNPGPLGFSDDGTRLAYSPARGSLGLAAAAPPHGWRRWPGSGGLGTVTCSEASPDGRRLAVATLDGLALWDAEHGRRLDFHPWQTAAVRWPWFRIAPAGDFLVCSDSDVPMTRWPITGTGFGTVESVVAPRSGTYIMHDFSRTGNDWLVSADRVQREISATTNFYIWPEGDPSRERLLAPAARANGLTLIPPGSRFALASHSHLADARLWDGATAREIRALGHPEPVLLAVSPDGTRACTIGAAEGRLWNTGGWSLIASWSQQGRGRSAPFFCPDSRYFATTTAAGHVTIRHAADGATYLELTPPRDLAAPEVRWLGRDRLLLVSSLDGFHEWNLAVLKAAATREGAPW